ncbi:hypothetical protein [Gallaecimonas mangrovi]|uniref:hypothetical protein n=1 Tax=Gallaecimonas mangrovi TaxID=2291597 RepID=UPI000E2011E3|nr:hypothetical protein [Gallaecimonas mangrovi]
MPHTTFATFARATAKSAGLALAALLTVFSVANLNSGTDTGGPMGFSSALLMLPALMLAAPLLVLSQPQSKTILGRYLLAVATVALALVLYNAWLYPTIDGAFYQLRDNVNDSLYAPPYRSQHLFALACCLALMYWGLVCLYRWQGSAWAWGLAGGQALTLFIAGQWGLGLWGGHLDKYGITATSLYWPLAAALVCLLLAALLKAHKTLAAQWLLTGAAILLLCSAILSGYSLSS